MKKLILSAMVLSGLISPISFANTPQHQVLFGMPSSAKQQKIVSPKSSSILDLTDLIKGTKFAFAVKNPQTGEITYTHDGIFYKRKGYFYQGDKRLQGFAIQNQLETSKDCKLADVVIPDEIFPPRATENIDLVLNLNANSSLNFMPFDKDDVSTYEVNVSSNIYMENGTTQPINIYFSKVASQTWAVNVVVNNQKVAEGSLIFNSNGSVNSITGLNSIPVTVNQYININFTQLTQYGSPTIYNDLEKDGYPMGESIAEVADANGYLKEYYSNSIELIFNKVGIFKAS